jgi:hypothetical protein
VGLFDHPAADPAQLSLLNTPAHRAVALALDVKVILTPPCIFHW